MNLTMQITNPESITVRPAVLSTHRKAGKRVQLFFRQTFQLLLVALLAVASYLAISHFFLQSVRVVGRSMVPTLYDSQHYLLNRWIFHVRPPQQGDIVVLRDPSDNGFSVKRVIATPGESVYLKDGKVYLNGRKLSESYLMPRTPTFPDSKYKDQLVLCGREQYYLLGDNRLNSVDSRTYGPVPRRNILGLLVR